MAQSYPFVSKPLGDPASADPLKRLSLVPRAPSLRDADERRTPAPRTASDADERLPLAPRMPEDRKSVQPPDSRALVPRTAHDRPLDDHAERLALEPRTLDPRTGEDVSRRHQDSRPWGSMGGRPGHGRMPLHKGSSRPMFALSDDRVMQERVLRTHSPDMLSFDVKSLLSVADDIFKSPVPTFDPATKTPITFKDYSDRASFEALAELIEQISCEIECKCLHAGESHHGSMSSGLHLDSRNTTAFSVLSLVSKYRWDAKVVLILAALAVKYGVFLLLAETYATSQLTKSLALIKQLPSLLSRPTALNQRLDKTRVLMQDMVELTNTIITIYELPPQFITEAFTDHVPTAVYWIVRSVLVCFSHISSISSFSHEQIMSFMEISEIHENSERLRKIDAYLKEQLKKILEEIEKKVIEDEFQELIRIFTKVIHVDVVSPLRRLVRPIDYVYQGEGHLKRKASIDVLSQKHVLLLISDLENLENELYILEFIYTNEWQQAFEIVWIPVVHEWTHVDKSRYGTLQSNMKWHVLGDPWMLRPAAKRFIREWWSFKAKPLLVALDSKGQVTSRNALPMVWIWQVLAHPFTHSRERDLWVEQEQAWNLDFLIDGTDTHTLNQIAEGKFVCLYGGESLEWIRSFTREWRSVARAAGIDLELVYVGKRNPKKGLQPIIDRIREEGLSHTLQDLFQIWFFWARIESMWESRQHVLKDRAEKDDKEFVLQEVITLLGYGGEHGGWGLVSRGTADELVKAKGDVFLTALTEYDQWQIHIETKGFLIALRDHLSHRLPPHHCTRFMLPESAGIIPSSIQCTECDRMMDKYYLFQCCLE